MKKIGYYHERAEEELQDLQMEDRLEIQESVEKLETDGYLRRPNGDKITKLLRELRCSGTGRGLYAFAGTVSFIVLKVWDKKQNPISQRHIKTAKKRFDNLDQSDFK